MTSRRPAKAQESRAVLRHASAERTQRLLLVADLMSRGEWVRGETAPRLAAQWGIAASTVENYSAEASRLVTLLHRDVARARLARALDAGMAAAEEVLETPGVCASCGGDCGHRALDAAKAIPQLADKYAALTGANEAERTEVTVSTAPTLATSPLADLEDAAVELVGAYVRRAEDPARLWARLDGVRGVLGQPTDLDSTGDDNGT